MLETEMTDNQDNINKELEQREQEETAEENDFLEAEGDIEDNSPGDIDKSDSLEADTADDLAGQSDFPDDPQITTIGVVEAVLFAADEPITANKLADIIGSGGVKEIKEHIEQLNNKYEQMDCSFRIENIAGGYQMLTLSRFNPWLRKLIQVRSETKLSPAAFETLAIVAYKQPIMRIDIENIRGVAAGEMLRQLIEKGLVKIVGRAQELGRPLLYGTTKRFLETFGLANLKDLPTTQDDKKNLSQ